MSVRFWTDLARHSAVSAFIVWVVASPPAAADLVYLKNGQVLEGLVVQTRTGPLRVKIGVGEIQLPRASILRIESGDPAALRLQWKTDYFDHPDFLPESCRSLALDYRSLEGARAEAIASARRIEQERDRGPALEQEEAGLRAESERLHLEIARRDDPRTTGLKPADVDAYNEQITHMNALASRMALIRNQRAALPASRAKDSRTISDYLLAVERFYDRLEAERKRRNRTATPEEQRFIATTLQRVSVWRGEILRAQIPHDNIEGHAIVSVRLNDRIDARMLLDTGASLVALSPALARDLGLPQDGTNRVSVRMADGTLIQTIPVRLDSVSVEDARVTGVEALVLPAEPAPGIDGLLGASFLREFVVRYDASAGRLELMRLRSGAVAPPAGGAAAGAGSEN
jgi:clan AA aspartic protease (TIGR02281 family)